ncbi:hypothetical protein T439DRAFT_345174 [Meredithblackwellia eburnea MCA 4105]
MSATDSKTPSDIEGQTFQKEKQLDSHVAVHEEKIGDRKLTWKQTAALLLTEYVVLCVFPLLAFPPSKTAERAMSSESAFIRGCLDVQPFFLGWPAILAFPWSFSATLVIGLATLWTSHVLWRYCMAYPQIRDICDAAYCMTGKRWAWWAAFVGLALNNYCIMGLHVVAGGTAIQTIRGGKECTLIWGVVLGVIMLLGSFMRDFKHMSLLGLLASSTMFICTLIVLAGHGVQGTPNGWVEGTKVTWTVWAPKGTTFVQALNALLNITYTWVGQALIPSFVGDMEHPEDFPKALYVSMGAEFILFTITGAVVYNYAGTQYTTAPGYGSLISKYGRVAAGFTLPTIIIVGILYSFVTSRAIFFQVFPEGSVHRLTHTAKGWTTWIIIVFGGWVISFIIGEAVPFFSDLLSLISSLFDSWFGFIFWGYGWYQINKGRRLSGGFQIWENVVAALMIITGVFFLVAGAYSSIQSILDSYAIGAIKKPFTCANTGFEFTR